MSLDHLTAQLPSERKPENRVFTVILCGDDERALQFVHNTATGQHPGFSAMPGAAAGLDMNATIPSAPIEEEQPMELPDSEEEMGGFKIPGFVRSAKKMLGGMGSSLMGLNSDFANMLGLIDTDIGPEGSPGQVFGARAKRQLSVCTRQVRSPTGKQQEWTIIFVWVKIPVPGYEGWKRVLRCVCSPARFPNAVVWLCRSEKSIFTNPNEQEGAMVLPRLAQLVPIVRILCSEQASGFHVAEVDGQRLGPESDGLGLALMRTGMVYPAGKELSSRRLNQQRKRKKSVRKVIKDAAIGAALGVLMPIPILDAGTVIAVELRMINNITARYAEMSPSRDIMAVQRRLALLMAPGVMALLPLQRVKLVPTAGPFLNMSANALLTFALGVATAEVFERLVEHQLLFDDGARRLFGREVELLKSQAGKLLTLGKNFAGHHGKLVLQKGKSQKKRVQESFPSMSRVLGEVLSALPTTPKARTTGH
jgi:uncharacterized protein (DUF697 family)